MLFRCIFSEQDIDQPCCDASSEHHHHHASSQHPVMITALQSELPNVNIMTMRAWSSRSLTSHQLRTTPPSLLQMSAAVSDSSDSTTLQHFTKTFQWRDMKCLISFFSQQFHLLCPYEFCALFVDFIFKLGGKIKVHKI